MGSQIERLQRRLEVGEARQRGIEERLRGIRARIRELELQEQKLLEERAEIVQQLVRGES